MSKLSESQARAQLQSDIMNVFHSNDWKDMDDFSVRLTAKIVSEKVTSEPQIRKSINSIRTTFFRANTISKEKVSQTLFESLSSNLSSYVYTTSDILMVTDVFPEISKISDDVAEARLSDFQKDERTLQNNLRWVFRKKHVSLAKRTHDSSKEVADIEKFVLNLKGRKLTLAVVVKGYKSIKKLKLTWEDLAHQITKARRGNPDHILIMSAKEPVDELITSIEEYNEDISRSGCVIFIPPLDMTRIFVANGL
jgi:hypothetical protein